MTPPPSIPDALWSTFPPAAQAIIVSLLARVAQLEAEVADLKAKLNRNSSNSSLPPSANPLHAKPAPPKPKSGKRRGGQAGHEKHERPRLPPDETQHRKPDFCRKCQHPLAGNDPDPLVHQVFELPEIRPKVVEYRQHRLTCAKCGTTTCGELPAGTQSGYGPRAEATVAYFGGALRASKRATSAAMGDLFGLPISPAAVCARQAATAKALEPIAAEALAYVRVQPAANIDETSWDRCKTKTESKTESNVESKPPANSNSNSESESNSNSKSESNSESKSKSWLWGIVTPLVTVFLIRPKRNREAFDDLVGPKPPILTSDRFKVYDHLDPAKRQVCWAHLIRDFQAMIDRQNAGSEVGEELLAMADILFEHWPKVRDGTMTRETFQTLYLPELRAEVRALLESGRAAACPKTAAACREILVVDESLWTFARVQGVEPTNDAAERALRHAVCWRKTSHGSQSEAGRRFAERILTTVVTCRQQGRSVLTFLTDAVRASRNGDLRPSLLPVGV